jgi:hypothetical protein
VVVDGEAPLVVQAEKPQFVLSATAPPLPRFTALPPHLYMNTAELQALRVPVISTPPKLQELPPTRIPGLRPIPAPRRAATEPKSSSEAPATPAAAAGNAYFNVTNAPDELAAQFPAPPGPNFTLAGDLVPAPDGHGDDGGRVFVLREGTCQRWAWLGNTHVMLPLPLPLPAGPLLLPLEDRVSATPAFQVLNAG